MLRRSFFESTSSSLLAEEVGLCSVLLCRSCPSFLITSLEDHSLP